MRNQTLTNYINKKTGTLYHGSELSYYDRFKSGNYYKVQSFQCNQNMPYAIDNGDNWKIVRNRYNKVEILGFVEKIK